MQHPIVRKESELQKISVVTYVSTFKILLLTWKDRCHRLSSSCTKYGAVHEILLRAKQGRCHNTSSYHEIHNHTKAREILMVIAIVHVRAGCDL